MPDLWLPFTQDTRQQGLSNASVTTVGSGASINANGKLGKCYYLDGTSNGYIATDFPTNFGTNDFTISLWVKIPTISTGNYYAVVSSKTSSAASAGVGIYWNYTQKKFLWSTADGTNATEIWMANAVDTIVYDKWIHLVMVRDNNDAKKGCFYINGTRYELASVPVIRNISSSTNLWIGRCSSGNYPLKMYISDIKIWNGRALSPKEIEILSRGLVAHYPLCDNSIQVSNVSNTSTTFNTSNADGGWSHWGQSGHKGSCGQTTNSTYIYTSGQTYAHRVTNASGATGNYLMYQSPSFSATGGYRSMSAIIKEVNSNKITDAICYPVWNGAADDKPYVWDIVSPLGNGFYLCKVESFQQDGTNNLVGIYVKPGKEIYVTNCYIENDRQACSDFIFGTNTTVYDCSGFQNNMTASGTVSCNVDSARYSKSTHFINGSYLMATQNSPTYLPTDGLTVNIWVKPTTWGTPISCTEGGGWNIELSTNGLQFQCYISSVGYKGAASTVKASDLIDGKWHMLTGTFDRIAQQTKFYIDGELKGTNSTGSSNGVGYANNRLIISGEAQTTTPTSSSFVGEESDVRIYATALSATQIAELYNTAVSVANNGALLGYELVEV